MKILGVVVMFALVSVSPAFAADQTIPLATMTCKQFTESPKDTVTTILTWMMGYNQDSDEPAELNFSKMDDLHKKLDAYCAQNPTHGIMAALDKVTDASDAVDTPTPDVLKSIVGLWTFPGKQVWIDVRQDGSAIQCRIDPSGIVYLSKGTFRAPDTLSWEKLWGDDKVANEKGAITLTGQFGSFIYKSDASGRPSELCVAS
jgi:HdeA/HdeB family